ncbi:MAG: hydroxymethylglutaryl-CoA lyase [Aquabacterium sp.]
MNHTATASPPPTTVTLREVGLRDGLQILPRVVPTTIKQQWLRRAFEAGLRHIEVGSFVPPKAMPQMADTAELLATAAGLPGLHASVLVPNLKGAQRALAAGARSMLFPLSASHAHSLANLKRTPDEALAELAAIVRERDAAGGGCEVEVGISTAFGCTIQGRVDPAEVLRLARGVLDAGADGLDLADTVGYADPAQVKRLVGAVQAVAGERLVGLHFHDTRGLGAANAMAGYECGIRRFDGCVGGLGGCPHAPGASGNVATEDLAYLFASIGETTGVDFDALMSLRSDIAQWLPGVPLYGNIWRAGLPATLKEPLAA